MLDTLGSFQPRAKGQAVLSSKLCATESVIDDLYQSGCMRILFPRSSPSLSAILINTSGGVTGGDRIAVSGQVGKGSSLTLTTQAAERAYRAQPHEIATIETKIEVADQATLHWLPQELILFDGCRLRRKLGIHLAQTGTALLVEPIIFGRTAMGEMLNDMHFSDRVSITRAGRPIYLDGINLIGDATAQLAHAATGSAATAMASIVYAAPDAARHITAIRALLPQFGGASVLADDLLAVRLLAQDSYLLRKSLIPIIEQLSNTPLPAAWRL